MQVFDSALFATPGPLPTAPLAARGGADLDDDARLEALEFGGLWGSAPESTYDELTELARRIFQAPAALFTLVGPEGQYLKSESGADPLLAQTRRTPLSHSVCRHVVDADQTLAVDDLREDPETAANGAVTDFGYAAYLGAPVRSPNGAVLGAFCVVDVRPRAWSARDVDTIEAMASAVQSLVRLRYELGFRRELEAIAVEGQRRARDRQKEAEQVARLKAAILSGMSHEIRTPLTGILGSAELLADAVGPELAGYVEAIQTGGERLLRTLSSVLDLAQIESQSLAVSLRPVDVAARARRAVDAAPPSGLALSVEAPPHGLFARADEGAVDRVLDHLIGNAVKYTDEGEVRVRVWEEAEAIAVEVADTGVGIPEAFQAHLFDAFRQATEGERRSYEGSGIGLAITRRLVDLMGGAIAVSSEEGRGSRFVVRLPRALGHRARTPHALPAPALA